MFVKAGPLLAINFLDHCEGAIVLRHGVCRRAREEEGARGGAARREEHRRPLARVQLERRGRARDGERAVEGEVEVDEPRARECRGVRVAARAWF